MLIYTSSPTSVHWDRIPGVRSDLSRESELVKKAMKLCCKPWRGWAQQIKCSKTKKQKKHNYCWGIFRLHKPSSVWYVLLRRCAAKGTWCQTEYLLLDQHSCKTQYMHIHINRYSYIIQKSYIIHHKSLFINHTPKIMNHKSGILSHISHFTDHEAQIITL